MKNVCVYDEITKYAHIIKSFLLAQNCRVSISTTTPEVVDKLNTGIFDGIVCVEDIPAQIWDILTNLYEGKIPVFFIGNRKNAGWTVNYSLREPFSLLDFAVLIKSFVNIMKKYDCVYYVKVKNDFYSLNCMLENPNKLGGIIYPASFTINEMNMFNDFFRAVTDTFEIKFLDRNEKPLIAKPIFYDFTSNKLIKEVFVNFINNVEYKTRLLTSN